MTEAELRTEARWSEVLTFCLRHMCQAPGCTKRRQSTSYCGMHDARFMRHGSINAVYGGPNNPKRARTRRLILSATTNTWQSTNAIARRTNLTTETVRRYMAELIALRQVQLERRERRGPKAFFWKLTHIQPEEEPHLDGRQEATADSVAGDVGSTRPGRTQFSCCSDSGQQQAQQV